MKGLDRKEVETVFRVRFISDTPWLGIHKAIRQLTPCLECGDNVRESMCADGFSTRLEALYDSHIS